MEHTFERPRPRSRLRQCTNPDCLVWETEYSSKTSCPQEPSRPTKKMDEAYLPPTIIKPLTPWADLFYDSGRGE